MISRRQFSQVLAATAAAAPLATTAPTSAVAPAAVSTPQWGQLKTVRTSLLEIGYAEMGPANGPVVILLHGWPYDIHAFVDVAPALAAQGHRVLIPYLRGYGTTRFLHARTMRNGQQSALGKDVIDFMDALKIRKATVAGFDWGARTACIVAALWPERVEALVSVSGYLVVNLTANQEPLVPVAELGWWYQYYFATERGVRGYTRNTREFNKLIWQNASPKWKFDDATYEQSARSFRNPDHVPIVIHNYRWRLQLAEGEQRYEHLERRLDKRPVIEVPTITIASDFDGPNSDGASYRKQFSGPYQHRVLTDIGHNVPQEAPREFTQAVLDVR